MYRGQGPDWHTPLTEDEVKTLLVGDKRLASIQTEIEGEGQRLPQQLAGRVTELKERYVKPLVLLEEQVDALSAKVNAYLVKLGIVWT